MICEYERLLLRGEVCGLCSECSSRLVSFEPRGFLCHQRTTTMRAINTRELRSSLCSWSFHSHFPSNRAWVRNGGTTAADCTECTWRSSCVWAACTETCTAAPADFHDTDRPTTKSDTRQIVTCKLVWNIRLRFELKVRILDRAWIYFKKLTKLWHGIGLAICESDWAKRLW